MARKLSLPSITLAFVFLAVVFLARCAPSARPAIEATVVPLVAKTQTVGWQDELEKTKAEAKKEGRVVIFSSGGAELRDGLTKIFRKEHAINLEWVVAPSADLSQKIMTEQRAGVYVGDVYLSGVSALLLAGKDCLQSADPFLFLPEVLDKKAWWGGDLIFLDEEHTWVAFLAFPQPTILVNRDLVKREEIKGYKDLLDPKWKGKMVLYNPRTGAGLAWAYHASEVIMYPEYLREFARQEPVVVDNSRLQCEWIARGKYPIAVAIRTENATEFINLGATVELISPVEGVHLTTSAGGVALMRNAAHPNAAKLLINWALTKEGGTALSKLIGGQSARLDVPADFLDPGFVRQPGVKYFNTITAEHTQKKTAFVSVAVEVFGPLMK